MAGTWMSVVKGFGGMRVRDEKLYFDPFIPEKWKSYSFRLEFRNRVIMIKVTKDKCETELESGEPLEIVLKGETVKLKYLEDGEVASPS
jgi:maltose phosphorylase